MNNQSVKKPVKMSRKKKADILKYSRIAVQIIFFITFPALFSQAFGGVKEVVNSMKDGKVLQADTFVINLLILCAVTVLFGRIFCGWACAFGAFGDWVFHISSFVHKKLKKKMLLIPDRALRIMKTFKYFVLAGILVLCVLGRGGLVTKYSPWTVFSLMTARNKMFLSYRIALLIMLLIVAGMAVKERFFCQVLCPLGAVFSLLPNVFSLIFKRNEKECIKGCRACQNNCPVGIKLSESPFTDGECIDCGRCVITCPKGNIGFCKSVNSNKKVINHQPKEVI